jgi:hypothetical protein
MNAIELISNERAEQLTKHFYTPQDDLKYESGELLSLAQYLMFQDGDAEKDTQEFYIKGIFDLDFVDKLESKPRKEKLVIAAALIAAHIDAEDLRESKENSK